MTFSKNYPFILKFGTYTNSDMAIRINDEICINLHNCTLFTSSTLLLLQDLLSSRSRNVGVCGEVDPRCCQVYFLLISVNFVISHYSNT